MKPPQEQFWAWLDSFWHKDEPIPQSAVENLVPTLQKKADLVDGVVPEEQLPFSVKTSEVIALGNVTVEGANANLAVHSSGANAVRVNGVIRERTFPNTFPFTPLSFGSVKVLRGYALNDPALFYMAEGEELDEYKEPEIPDTALEIFKITLTPAGAIIDILSQIGGFKPKESDAWKSVLLTNDAATFLQHTVEASTYELNVSGAVSAPKICGLITKQGKYMWGGKPLLLYNNSGLPVQLLPAESIPENPNAKYIPFATGTSYIIKPGEYVLIKEKADKLIIVRLGGSASFPEGAAPGDVLTEGTEGPEWSNRLTNVETNKQDKSMFSALVDKWIHYYDVGTQKMQPILKFVAGVVNQLEFTGRIKADAIVLPANSNPVVPNRLRSDGNKLFFANDMGMEEQVSTLADFANDRLVATYTHNSNPSYQPTAVDWANGNVTVSGHGLSHTGQRLCGLFGDLGSIPQEWCAVMIYVKVVDSNTLKICDVNGNTIIINTGANGNQNININGFHIEFFTSFYMSGFNAGERFIIEITGKYCNNSINTVSNSNRYFMMELNGGTKLQHIILLNGSTTFPQSVNSSMRLTISFTNNPQFPIFQLNELSQSRVNNNNVTQRFTPASVQHYIYGGVNGDVLTGFYSPNMTNAPNSLSFFGNGTVIKIFRQ